MIDLSIANVTKEFEVGRRILDGLTFQVDTGERVGLLGKNGAGKTTLFKIITGELYPDEGEVVVAPGKRVGLISQIPVYPADYTVESVLDDAFARLKAIEEEEGAEASARELEEIIELVKEHQIPAIFVEKNGSRRSADVIARETGCQVYELDMVMSGDGMGMEAYIRAMEENLAAVREGLG